MVIEERQPALQALHWVHGPWFVLRTGNVDVAVAQQVRQGATNTRAERLCTPPADSLGPPANDPNLRIGKAPGGNHLIDSGVELESFTHVIRPMVGDEAKRCPPLPGRGSDGMKDRWVGTVEDHRMGSHRVEPARGVIVPKPIRDKNRVIRSAVGLGQESIHGVGSFARIVVVNALDADEAGFLFFGPENIIITEGQRPAETRMRSGNAIDLPIEMVLDSVSAALQIRRKLIQPLIAASIRTAAWNHVECDRRDGPASSREPAHAAAGKKVSAATVVLGPRI